MKLNKNGEPWQTFSIRKRKAIRFEIYINSRRVYVKKNWQGLGEYRALIQIRERIAEQYPNQDFEVYKVMKSMFPPVEAEVVNLYSNVSPMGIAKAK